MIGVAVAGVAVTYIVNFIPQLQFLHLWWIFNTVGATIVVPTILSLYWKRLSAQGVLWGVGVSFVIGLPFQLPNPGSATPPIVAVPEVQ